MAQQAHDISELIFRSNVRHARLTGSCTSFSPAIPSRRSKPKHPAVAAARPHPAKPRPQPANTETTIARAPKPSPKHASAEPQSTADSATAPLAQWRRRPFPSAASRAASALRVKSTRPTRGLTSRVCQGRSDWYAVGRGDADGGAAVPASCASPVTSTQPKFKEFGGRSGEQPLPVTPWPAAGGRARAPNCASSRSRAYHAASCRARAQARAWRGPSR
jgi:hypothetical protein